MTLLHVCDLCARPIAPSADRYRCDTCGEDLCDRCYMLKIHPTTHEIRRFRGERQKIGRPKRTTTGQSFPAASVSSNATESKDHDAEKPSDPSTRNAKDEDEEEKVVLSSYGPLLTEKSTASDALKEIADTIYQHLLPSHSPIGLDPHALASFYTLSGSPQPGTENIPLLLITTDNINNHNDMNLTNRLLSNLYRRLSLEHTAVIPTAAHRPRSATPILTLRGFLALLIGHLRATPEKAIKMLNSLLALIPSYCGPEIPRECAPRGAGDPRIHKVMAGLQGWILAEVNAWKQKVEDEKRKKEEEREEIEARRREWNQEAERRREHLRSQIIEQLREEDRRNTAFAHAHRCSHQPPQADHHHHYRAPPHRRPNMPSQPRASSHTNAFHRPGIEISGLEGLFAIPESLRRANQMNNIGNIFGPGAGDDFLGIPGLPRMPRMPNVEQIAARIAQNEHILTGFESFFAPRPDRR
ncbi:hypothetical protein EX30DRAFT_338342 [Ascodesmis nigricans]|uniref:DUF7514 domain-containing protein n=1 Tax=Ascodesmis nigricans TaxID=341454 RepID=A0A4S2N3U4_9PEZI|nr:hypothetical protein EX30DRAFT_338342 [Ascodesmis nigricans]